MRYHREATSRYHKLIPFIVSKTKWNTKKDKGKSEMHLLYVYDWRKGTSQEKAMSNSEEIKPVAICIVELCIVELCIIELCIVELCLAEGIS